MSQPADGHNGRSNGKELRSHCQLWSTQNSSHNKNSKETLWSKPSFKINALSVSALSFSQFPHSSCIVISSWTSVRLALFVVWSLHFSVDIFKLPFTWRWYLFTLSRLRNVKFIFLFCQVSREHLLFLQGLLLHLLPLLKRRCPTTVPFKPKSAKSTCSTGEFYYSL